MSRMLITRSFCWLPRKRLLAGGREDPSKGIIKDIETVGKAWTVSILQDGRVDIEWKNKVMDSRLPSIKSSELPGELVDLFPVAEFTGGCPVNRIVG